jgi:cephalosporin hydroxylase
MFFEDMARILDLDAKVISIDWDPPVPAPDCQVEFLKGDVLDLDNVFASYDLFVAPRPWLVVEDSAHTFEACSAVLQFFSRHMKKGEILIIEDGIIQDLGWSDRYSGGPNQAISEWMQRFPSDFGIATEYTDMFGINMTYNPNGYLRRQ